MRKTTILLSIMVLAAMVLAACGGGATSTNVAPTQLPITAVATEPATATEMPTEAPVATETAGVPVTGEVNPARVSNELDFNVVDQSGNQVGNVDDMILDLDNTSVAYVIVSTGGLAGVGGKKVAVPWNDLQLQTGTGTGTGTGSATSTPGTDTGGTGLATSTPETGGAGTGSATSTPAGIATGLSGTGTDLSTSTPETGTGDSGTSSVTSTPGTGSGSTIVGQQNVFVLQVDPNTLNNAPEFDPNSLPQMGQSASGWDSAIQSFWQGAANGTGTGSATSTPGTGSTGLATSTPETGTGATSSTSTPSTGTGSGTGTGGGTQGTMALQGVALASDVLGATVTIGMQGGAGTGLSTSTPEAGTGGTGTGSATSTPGTGTDLSTATPETSTGSGTGTGITGSVSATIEDLIVNTNSGDIQYLVVNATLSDGEHLIPVPLSMFQWDGTTQAFVLNADAAMLQSAPSFQNGQFPDTSMSGWDTQFQSFWQGNGAGGANPTATP